MRKSLRLGALSMLLSLMASFAFAQDVTVSGKIISAEDDAPLPGVNVLVKGTTTGVVSGIDGTYRINAPSNAVLVYSFIGMQTQEIAIGSQSVIDVVMDTDLTQLSEVVVVGYGTQNKAELTGSVSTLDSESLQQQPMASFEQSLQGKMAGVQATAIDGAPGANTQVRIRGIGSITASSEPLYVIDGIPMQSGDISYLNGNGGRSGNVMAAINPNDIASVTVLKDAASTAIYGSRGANGVILITTKTGKAGKSKINFNSLVGFNSIAANNYAQPLNADQYYERFIEGYTNRGETQAEAQQRWDDRFEQLTDPSTGQPTDTDWLDAVTRTGVTQSYDLNSSGGTEDLTYFFSASYFDQESHVIGTDFERLTARVNLAFNASDNVTITNNVNVSSSVQNGMVDGSAWANPMYNAMLLAPVIPIYDDQGRYNAEHKNYYPMGGNNPAGALGGDDLRESLQLRIIDNLAISIDFAKNFNFRSQWNFDIIQLDEAQYKNPRYGDGRNSGGYNQTSATQNKNWVGTQTLNYGITLNDAHNLDVLLGYEAQRSTRNRLYGYGEEFPNDKLKTIASAAAAYDATSTRSEYTFASLFTRVNYDFNARYFLSASLRRDGSSRFGADNRWGTFYSIGGAWAINNEVFMDGTSVVNNLKLRLSYGVTGNAAIGNFPSIGLYGYGQDYDGAPGGSPSQIENSALTWESQNNFNIGLDFGLWNRLNGTVEYFDRTSTDLILDVPISRTTGFSSLTQNFGEMKNTGVELSMDGDIINNGEVIWNLGFSITWLTNEITKLEEDYNDGTKRRQAGSDYQSYYLIDWAGVDPSNGLPQYYTDSSRSEITNNVNEADRFMVGKSATPDYFGGITTMVAWKGLTFDMAFTYSQGNWIYDPNGRHVHGDGRLTPRSTTTWGHENRWTPQNTDALLPILEWGGQSGSGQSNMSRWLYDGSFFRLRSMTLAYVFPFDIVDRLQLSSLRFYVRGNNLATWQKDENLILDPEQAISGVANWLTPPLRTFSLGLDIGF